MKTYKELKKGDLFVFNGNGVEFFMIINYGDKGCVVCRNENGHRELPVYLQSEIEEDSFTFIRTSTPEEDKFIAFCYCQAIQKRLSDKLRRMSKDMLKIAQSLEKDYTTLDESAIEDVFDDMYGKISDISFGITVSERELVGIKVDNKRYINGKYDKIGER